MSTKEQMLNIIFIFVVAMALGSILGLSILRTVDKRMSDIAINIPEIKMPNVKIDCPHNTFYQDLERNYHMKGGNIINNNIKSQPEEITKSIPDPNGNDIFQQLNKNIVIDNVISKPIPNIKLSDKTQNDKTQNDTKQSLDFVRSKNRINDANYYLSQQQLESHKSSLFQPIDPNDSYLDIDYLSINKHQQPPPIIKPECQYNSLYPDSKKDQYFDRPCDSQQYYKNPDEMDMRQVMKFKKYAKFDKMTLTDYINWLSLYVNDDSEQLSLKNQQNLLKYLQNKPITEQDIPRASNTNIKSSQELWQQSSLI